MSDSINADVLSDLTKARVLEFEAKKSHYDAIFQQFQDAHQAELMQLDNAREEVNASLDVAKRAMRDDAVEADYRRIKRIKFGSFSVVKKWTSFYIVEMFVDLLRERGIFDAAVDEGVINVTTHIKATLATEFLRKNSLENEFKVCMDGKEQTPAVTCPKPIAGFGGVLVK